MGLLGVLRWGCTAETPLASSGRGVSINGSRGIHTVNNKTQFLLKLQEEMEDQTGLLTVMTASTSMRSEGLSEVSNCTQWVVRPHHHSQGRNLRLVSTEELGSLLAAGLMSNHYARPLIQKKAEYRVYVMNGRVVNVAQKTPGNPADIAWNVARGGRFDNVRWGSWPTKVVDLACRVFPHTGLNITGIDIMVDHDDNAWFIEANSAPSLPFNSDGSTTHRQQCVAKGIHYMLTVSNEMLTPTQDEGWRGYIHPAIWPRASEQQEEMTDD
jgi:glutathione synthase/RimK-type ligase-like ATP-grasp enzyme